jgi:hypothetical protein
MMTAMSRSAPGQQTVTGPAAHFPVGNTTTYDLRPFLDPAVPFDRLPPKLRGMNTHMVYISPTNQVYNLAGPNAGRQGVRAATQMVGDQGWPFEQVVTNSPYIMGAEIERTNIPQREYNLGVIIGRHAPPMTEYEYRMAEDHWWSGQDENNDGWLGVYTRFSGWRWDPVRPLRTVATPQKLDATAYGNNASQWDITWLASRPYFTKPALYRIFNAREAGAPAPPPDAPLWGLVDQLIGNTYYWGTLPIANRSDLPSFVTYYVSSPGQAIVQDNDSSRLVPLPSTTKSVGTYMCDTEPGHRTLTAANDPQDNLLFDLIRQSTILNFFLGGIANMGIPLALQFNNRFIYQIPPHSVVHLTVGHSDPNGVIMAMVSQRFKRSR